jgi:hypothetical protein
MARATNMRDQILGFERIMRMKRRRDRAQLGLDAELIAR